MHKGLTILVPDEAELLQIAQLAQAQHLYLITNGKRSVLSPSILPGWRLHNAGIKPQRVAA